MKKIALLLTGVILPVIGYTAAPEISVGMMQDYIDADKSSFVKRIRNDGDATAFVKVDVSEIVPGNKSESNEKPAMDINQVKSSGGHTLIASPARLIIPAKSMQTVRLLVMGDRQQERYYRVRYIPVMPDSKGGFNVSQKEVSDYGATLSAGVNILAGYGTIVYVRPGKVSFNTDITQNESGMTVRNNGNSVIFLDHFKTCDSNGKNCDVTAKHHILPGASRDFTKKAGQVFHFQLIEGDKTKRY
ncbi:hypothetical protein M977_00211 [Buttiauxella gaviniae ATCC 51604]|uniref:Pilus assembly protein n=1 Tax=Buttiauxella gaviniae ATCC 51604 TaxID=1354253 RepID=A0A1B7I647_9ENTR|nr:hypothetical protein [Buttiauxella gaviniae]OAT23921.1 hypothetical protein M977_00211 [Buttiauxella gaviniae ATCC 51604]